MKRKWWLIFGFVQLLGIAAAVEAAFFQEPLLLIVSVGLLFPGSLAWVHFVFGRIGANPPLWTLGAVSVTANVLLFAFTSYLVAKFRIPR